jgi:hypothetical protein
MPKERKHYQRKSLGSTRVDLSLKKKKQFLRKIITFGESYKKVSADFKKQTGKWLPRSTFNTWKKTGKDILDAEFTGCTHRKTHKQSEDQERFETKVLQRIQSSKTDVEGVRGTKIILQDVQAEEEFQASPEIQKFEFTQTFIERVIRKYNMRITKVTFSKLIKILKCYSRPPQILFL